MALVRLKYNKFIGQRLLTKYRNHYEITYKNYCFVTLPFLIKQKNENLFH
ncbi:hypothetical protein M23134_07567 [Microscilla marina ATCC 23134]|uniref:Uncharacterized protein n=1 Tax=Microscilla marina ATCC 23134 TaxID=313606 RepID=A1ZF55_MICM2|nr:hypothetical protein M23134_07567 [Microscilla marina ATCC 23134]